MVIGKGLAAAVGICGLLAVAWSTSAAAAEGRVELTVTGDTQSSGEFHQWMQALARAGVNHVRLRAAEATDQVGIEVQGTTADPVYLVTATLTAQGELLLPGGRFRRSEAGQVGQWVKDLAANGPPDRREAKSAFGLTLKQFAQLHDDLSQPVGVSTHGVARGTVVARIVRRLHFPLPLGGPGLPPLGEDPVVEELSGLTCGTALACVLRPAGLCLVPQSGSPQPSYRIADARTAHEIWPVGWPPQKPPHDVLPSMFEFLNVNIQGATAAKAMEALATRMKVPLLVDHNALARYGIDPEKVVVSLPHAHTMYCRVLQKVLFKAGLKEELRVDEAGSPLLWVTSLKAL
jgi:hypothetical protein